jgi:hypothetical protein
MGFLYNATFGWCFVLGEIVVIFVAFMILHRHALRRHEELMSADAEENGDTQ